MAGVTKEEISRAKELDLLTYFKLVEPGNLKLVGKEYRHKIHSSLTISKDSLWCWHCIGLHGRTALKYLIDVEKVPYVEAVREINRIQGGVVHSSQPVSLPQPWAEPEVPRDFKLPNEIIIPMQAQPFSVVGMSQLTSSIANVQRKINPGLRVKGILLTMTEHTNVSDHYCGQVRSTYGNKIHVFTTEIPRNVKVQESQANAEPTILYDPKSNSAKAYIEFAKEVSGYGREEQVFERDEDALNR